MTTLPKNTGKEKKKFVKPFKVVKVDTEHLQDMVRQAREKEKYWRAIGQEADE